MQLNKIHHIAIIVSDYDKSKHFYTDLLGFEIIKETIRPEKNDIKLDLKAGNCELEIFYHPDAPKRLNYPEACGLRHLAFKSENIEEDVKALINQGILVEEIRIDPLTNKKMTFFKDPDGLPLELHE